MISLVPAIRSGRCDQPRRPQGPSSNGYKFPGCCIEPQSLRSTTCCLYPRSSVQKFDKLARIKPVADHKFQKENVYFQSTPKDTVLSCTKHIQEFETLQQSNVSFRPVTATLFRGIDHRSAAFGSSPVASHPRRCIIACLGTVAPCPAANFNNKAHICKGTMSFCEITNRSIFNLAEALSPGFSPSKSCKFSQSKSRTEIRCTKCLHAFRSSERAALPVAIAENLFRCILW